MTWLRVFWVALLIVPSLVAATSCAAVLAAEPRQRVGAWHFLVNKFVITVIALAGLIYLVSALAGATGNRADVRATLVWTVFKSGLFMAVLGQLTPIILSGWIINRGGGAEAARWVWLAPVPVVVSALAVAGYFALWGGA